MLLLSKISWISAARPYFASLILSRLHLCFRLFLSDTVMNLLPLRLLWCCTDTPSQCLETNAEKIYNLGVNFAGGYVVGVFYAIVSRPPCFFSQQCKRATVGDVSGTSIICLGTNTAQHPLTHILSLDDVSSNLHLLWWAGSKDGVMVSSHLRTSSLDTSGEWCFRSICWA